MNFILCQWLKWRRFKVNFEECLDGVYLNSALCEVQLLRIPALPGWCGELSPWFGASGSGDASLFPAHGDSEHRDLLPAHRKQLPSDGAVVVAHWNSFAGEWSKEKAFRQIALWISALHLLFLVCGTHVVCHEWNAAERRVKGEKIWERQGRRILIWTSTTPKMNVLIGHCLFKENLNMQTNKAKYLLHPLTPQQNNTANPLILASVNLWCDWFHLRHGKLVCATSSLQYECRGCLIPVPPSHLPWRGSWGAM